MNQELYAKNIPKVKRETFTNISFSVMGPRLWNNIPNEVKECVDIEIIKDLSFLINFK